MDEYELDRDSQLAGPTGPLCALQGHMLMQHLVTTSAQEWTERLGVPQTPMPAAANGPAIIRVPVPGTQTYAEYEAHIITAAESQLDAIVPSIEFDGKTPVHGEATVGTVLRRLGALSLDHRSDWQSIVAIHLSSVLDNLACNKTVRFKRIQGCKFASIDGKWLIVSEVPSTQPHALQSSASPAPQQPPCSKVNIPNASNDSLLPISTSPAFAALSSTSAAHADKGNHLTAVAVSPPTAAECNSATSHSPPYPNALSPPHAPFNLPTAAQLVPYPLSLPCSHAAFTYDAQWTGHAITDPRPCFENGEQLLLADTPIVLSSNGGPVLDFGRPTDSYWSDLMEAENNSDRLAGFDIIREPVWQTHRSLAAIQLFGRMFDLPFATCPVFAAHITHALDARISAMVESEQVSSEGEMGDMALMWVKEEVAWYAIREVLEMDGVEQSEVDGAFYLVEDNDADRIECRESLLAAIGLYRAEWGMPEPQIAVEGNDSAVDLPGLV